MMATFHRVDECQRFMQFVFRISTRTSLVYLFLVQGEQGKRLWALLFGLPEQPPQYIYDKHYKHKTYLPNHGFPHMVISGI